MIRFFIHPKLQDPTHKNYKKALIYTWAMFIVGLFLIPYALYFLIAYPEDGIKNLTNVLFGGLFISALLIGRYTNRIDYAISFVALISYPPIMITLYTTGGLYSVEVVWIFVCLIAHSIFINYRVGIVGGIIVVLFYTFLYSIERYDSEKSVMFKNYILTHSSLNNYLTLSFVTLLVMALLVSFSRALTSANKKIDDLSKDKIINLERVLAEKTNELSSIRQSLAKDFHDEMGNKLASISILAQAIALKTKERVNSEETTAMLNSINIHAKELYEGTKDFIWSIDFKHDYVNELYSYLREFGENFFSKLNLNFLAKHELQEEHMIRIDPFVGR